MMLTFAGEVADNGCNKIGLESINHLLGPDGAGHGGAGGRGNNVGNDTVLLALDGQSLGETDDTSLSGRVVGLTEVAVCQGLINISLAGTDIITLTNADL